jgi:hypothetical protein
MNNVTVITHFSNPNWPVVNKLAAICKCLDVTMVHCPTIEKLKSTLSKPVYGRGLFFTDEGLVDYLQELDSQPNKMPLEVAMLIMSPISMAAQKVSDLGNVKYLIGIQSVESYGRDLSILIKKFSDGDILDLDKYLAFGCKINSRTITTSKSKRDAIMSVSSYISQLGEPGYTPYEEYARRVAELSDELLLNAIFDANPRLKNADRSQPFQLTEQEQIHMSWGYDGEYFGVSVRDPFGKFNSETIMSYLSAPTQSGRIHESKSAGLGLKLIFEKAHQVVTNVKHEQVTEVIALVKFVNRMLEFDNQKKSFFFFGGKETVKK